MRQPETPTDLPTRGALRMDLPARADHLSVEEIVRRTSLGRLRLPRFQRRLAWDSSDRRNLLDSIERGYPIGTLLLWRRPVSSADGMALAGAPPAPEQGELDLIVDGQQRIVTLWDALGRVPEAGEQVLGFEIPDGSFRFRQVARTEGGATPAARVGDHWFMPLHIALDATALSEWMPQDVPRDVRRRLFDVGKRIREYKVAVYVVEGDDVEVLREVFDRVNSTGKPLTRDDVFDALVGSKVADGDDSGLAVVNARLRELEFGDIARNTILNAFEAVRGGRIGKVDPRAISAGSVEADLERTAAALRATIVFLQSVASVPHGAVLPYELPLVVLPRFFSRFPHPSERSLSLLRRWLWRGSIAARLGGASGTLQQHVDDIVEGSEHGSVQALLRRTGQGQRVDLREPAKFSVGTAAGKMMLCAMLADRPRDLLTGEVLAVTGVFAEGLDGALRPIGAPADGGFANRLLHPPVGLAPARLIERCTDEAALLSHRIRWSAANALRAGDVARFVAERQAELHTSVAAFLERNAEWERDDSPPVEALAATGTGT